MNRPPLAVLKIPLLTLVLATLLAGAGILWSRSEALTAAAIRQQRQDELDRAQQQLERSRQQQSLIAAHLADYQALAARGFIGAEDRLAWVEAIQLANRDADLYGLDYRLTPRTTSAPGISGNLPLGQTSMTVSMPLLVETDLPRFLAALKARAAGIYRLHGCRLTHAASSAAFQAVNAPQIRAECEFLWFTVDTTKGSKP